MLTALVVAVIVVLWFALGAVTIRAERAERDRDTWRTRALAAEADARRKADELAEVGKAARGMRDVFAGYLSVSDN